LLRWRLLLGGVLIAALVGLVRLDYLSSVPATWLFPLAVLAAIGAANEVVSLLATGGRRPLASVIYGGTVAVIASNAIPLFILRETDPLARLGWPLLAYTLVILAALVGEMIRYRQPGGVMVNVALTVFGVAYSGLLVSFAVQLRVLGQGNEGLVALVALIAVVKFGDTGAYTMGRLFGRHKMAPLISPGKTWEGAAGAMGFAVLGSWLSFTLLPQWQAVPISQPRWAWIVFGLVVGLAGLLGDLAESLFKRDMGSKDSSTWLPGFGGVLDLLDSILFAAPVAFVCWLLLGMI
jgi:phosphatidate cytidylyltransferase